MPKPGMRTIQDLSKRNFKKGYNGLMAANASLVVTIIIGSVDLPLQNTRKGKNKQKRKASSVIIFAHQ